MLVKDKQGREIELSIMGHYDDIEIDDIYYVDESITEDVSEETIAYICANYVTELQDEYSYHSVAQAEAYYDKQ